MEHEEAQSQINQQNIPNNPNMIHFASDEDTKLASNPSNDSSFER